jgi:4-amino-4-deoxy-L-arabinose transferase-like glycosyltransferase
MGALLLWLTVRAAQTGFSVRSAGLLGIVGGVGVLMKLTALSLLPPVVGLMAFYGWRAKKLPGVWPLLAAFAFGLALTTGWWFARNFALYGETTALNINLENFDGRTSVWEGVQLWPEMLPYAWTTFWGRIGHGSIVLPAWVYQALGMMVLVAGLGWLRLRGNLNARVAFLFAAGLFAFLGLMVYITLSPTGGNGRYAYPALPAYMSLLAAGLLANIPERVRHMFSSAVVGVMFVFSASVLAFFVAPAYAPPPVVAQLPASATPLNARLWEVAIIRGYEFTPPANASLTLSITVYWEPLGRTSLPYSVFVHLIDAQTEALIAQRDTYPGLGRNPTTTWEPGQLFADRYEVILPEGAVVKRAYWKVGLWQAETGDRAWVLDSAGELIDSGQRLAEFTWPLPAR